MNTTKIVFIGAGSMSFGLSMFRDIFSTQELAGSTLTLVDLNEEYLERMYQLALRMNAESGSGLMHRKDRGPPGSFTRRGICGQQRGHRPQPAVEI